MSYPEARHLSAGEVRAKFRPATAGPEITNMPSNNTRYLATGESTDGQFGLYQWDFGPKRSGPSAHFHRAISESFFILNGTVRLFDGDRWMKATAGDFLYVPQGGIHAFRNESDELASMLLLFTPGAPREAYFETLAEIGQRRRSQMTRPSVLSSCSITTRSGSTRSGRATPVVRVRRACSRMNGRGLVGHPRGRRSLLLLNRCVVSLCKWATAG
jgi:mannose-6-phosphate isomerase-like protein (cupin superfamily)